jgi:hypothetical protein
LKTEVSTMFMHRLFGWCKTARKVVEEAGPRKVSKFISMYGLYIGIVWTFDYAYMPWLAIKFRYLTFFPLYFSLFAVCSMGLFLYEFFNEDMFFKEKLQEWLSKDGKYKFTRVLKKKINSNPNMTFAAIATWWSPLHAYIYFRKGEENHFWNVITLFGKGSFYCAFFWGVIAFILSALWDLTKLIIKLYL